MSICSVAIGSSGAGATGTTCVSYGDCDLGCCTKTYSNCTGTSTYDCNQWTLPAGCAAAGAPATCCNWQSDLPPGERCANNSCYTLGSAGDCATCGCTPGGTCIKIACGSLTGASQNPDVCPGCDTCAGDWLVSDARDLPWTVYVGTLSLSYTGSPSVSYPSAYAPIIG